MSEERWRPDANFFEQSGRSSHIRGVCLEILAILEKVYQFKGRSSLSYRQDLLNLYSVLELYDGYLIELGIDQGTLLKVKLEETDPDTLAEWLASQIIVLTGPTIDTFDDLNILSSLLETFNYYFDAPPPEGV